jgi:hypothetical protein
LSGKNPSHFILNPMKVICTPFLTTVFGGSNPPTLKGFACLTISLTSFFHVYEVSRAVIYVREKFPICKATE